MRIVPNKIFTVVVLAFTNVTFARYAPPPPRAPGGPPGLPVDDGLVYLFIAAIVFGIYKVYQFRLNKKAPM